MTQTLFYILAGVIVVSAVLTVTVQNLFHCALALALTMFGVAGVFLFLGQEFLAVVQVLIYVGAVTVLIIFGIMLTYRVMDAKTAVMNKQVLLSVFAAVAVMFVLFKVISHSGFQGNEHPMPAIAASSTVGEAQNATPAAYNDDVTSLAAALLKPENGFAFAFELVSILLLSALVGAMVVARKDPE